VGSVAFNASDERIKKEIETASDNLAMAMRLRPVTFRYKNIGVWNDSTAQRGFIAQEVAEVVPEGAYGEVFPEDSDQETPTNPMGINILPLISVLTGAVQEQQELITKLTERIDHQDELIKSLLEK
ncbi:tail fiber domain-containing protein, partial [Serratia marcescens]